MSEKISQMPAAGALTGSELVPIVQSGDNKKTTVQDMANLAADYLVYVALLTQSGTNAPVATILKNTLGGTVTYSYSDLGVYYATLSNPVDINKSFCRTGGPDTTAGCSTFTGEFMNSTSIQFIASEECVRINGLLLRSWVEIIVYL